MTVQTLLADLSLMTPELILAIGAMVLLMVGVFAGKDELKVARLVSWLAIGLLAAAAIASMLLSTGVSTTAFEGAFIHDTFSLYAKSAIYLAAIVAMILAINYLETEKLARFEYPVLIVLAVTGMSLMVSSNDLMTLYLGLEMQSLALYILAAFNRDSQRASEAGLKYFVLGALSSGLLLYGASLVYGFAGGTSFAAIAAAAESDPDSLGLLFGLVFLLSGLAFKVSAAPFHMWTPDVYEGAPTPVAAFFATAPKLAAMVLIARVLTEPFAAMADQWQQIVIVLAILSMGIGAFGALMQSNIKRLMAYSSIANMGYVLVGLASGTQIGVWAVLLYMTLYIVGVAGTFGVILSMRRSEGMVERVEDLSGLAQTNPGLGLAITGLLLSIGGMPFLVGFFGKLFVFYAAVEAGLIWLAVVGALFSIVSISYYLAILKRVWFDEPRGEFLPAPAGVAAVTRIAGLSTVVLLPFVALLFAQVIRAGGGIGG
ncbi:NADH-quinone oxidoreductase subunit N [Marinicauda pacifica]|jgi:NADH-quinone oxidoreductase subunit N|uniref:NADH-quinone oxidoreductase subunit N n=1 Tax=Marinicauda pacifica TaxID=1133559 RepID=A0A4S2HEE0_9PROT|nr:MULTISPECIES: NADH-quinone oxidoreductase subunit NuoN [Marinicauda]TGY94435.1 NADH-quinone oxidoreductase subunit NuoN [Marinicauda pacifica]GGE35806.1 NADH-quinone oxidoreductase subunit N [Marinicauda pacifica]